MISQRMLFFNLLSILKLTVESEPNISGMSCCRIDYKGTLEGEFFYNILFYDTSPLTPLEINELTRLTLQVGENVIAFEFISLQICEKIEKEAYVGENRVKISKWGFSVYDDIFQKIKNEKFNGEVKVISTREKKEELLPCILLKKFSFAINNFNLKFKKSNELEIKEHVFVLVEGNFNSIRAFFKTKEHLKYIPEETEYRLTLPILRGEQVYRVYLIIPDAGIWSSTTGNPENHIVET